MDQNKKTMRHFYCRDVLWETFEQMANDFDCSIDYLVNEAMRSYARSKNYQSPQTSAPVAAPPSPASTRDAQREAQSNVQSNGNAGDGEQTPPAGVPAVRAPTRPPPAPAASAERRSSTAPPAAPPKPASRNTLAPVSAPVAPGGAGSPLFLFFNNQRFSIEKDQFIIGRGSKTSDLPIKDGNISRKHAAVVRRNGVFYIKDLGSTNGIDYKGMRIDNKRIDEGDVFHLCDYELKFTYRG